MSCQKEYREQRYSVAPPRRRPLRHIPPQTAQLPESDKREASANKATKRKAAGALGRRMAAPSRGKRPLGRRGSV